MFTSVQFRCSVVSDSLWPHGLQRTRPPCLSPTPGVYPNSHPLSRWCHPTISSSVIPFSFCLQSFQHQGIFQWVSSLHQVAKVLELQLQLQPQSFQWIFRVDFLFDLLAVERIQRVFSSTTVQTYQFFNTQTLLWSKSNNCTWLLEKAIALTLQTFVGKMMSTF